MVKDGSIFVPSSGPYFLYNRVEFNAYVNSTVPIVDVLDHAFRYSNTGHSYRSIEANKIKFESHNNYISIVSSLEKIEYLEEGSQIKVALDLPQYVDMKPVMTMGTFGMFRL